MEKLITNFDNMHAPINILLADDDNDDREFFENILDTLPFFIKLTNVVNGEKLMAYLLSNTSALPDIIFLDLNMPRKNGLECLEEIKLHEYLKHLPVIILSTSLHADLADLLYQKGAYYYMRKTDLSELRKMLHHLLTMMTEKKFARPLRDRFVLSLSVV